MRVDRCSSLLLLLVSCAAPTQDLSPVRSAAREEAPRVAIDASAQAIQVLLEETHVSYDEDGRMTARYRLRYRLEKASALESYGVAGTIWSPWYEAEPQLHATVTRQDGSTSTLDPSTIEVSSVGGRGVMFADSRRLRAPLPNLEVGAIIDRVIEGKDHAPFFTGGRRGYHYFGSGVPTQKSRLTIEAPAEAPLVWAARGIDIAPIEDEVTDGRRRVVFEGGPYTDQAKYEPNAPWDPADEPHIVFSVAPSWSAIASAYAELVDERIAEGPPALEKREGDRASLIRRLLADVHARVRYTGLELGVQAIVPVSPRVVLERGYGDCKDKATLLVALLREHGIEAYVALVRAGVAPVEPSAPGLNAFNHAIVYVPGTDPLWIDATADQLPVGDLPLVIQGQSALIARRSEEAMVVVPELPSAANLYREERQITMATFGPGTVVERTSGRGATAEWIRQRYLEIDQANLEKSMKAYVADVYGAEDVVAVKRAGFESVDKEVVLHVEAVAPEVSQTSEFDGEVLLDITPLLDLLPAALRVIPKDGETLEPRTRPLRFHRPVAAEMVYRVRMPKGFVPRAIPESKIDQLGPATLRRDFELRDDVVVATYRLDVGPRQWRAEEVNAFREKYPDLIVRDFLQFEHEGERLRAQGDVVAALSRYRRLAEAEPEVARHHTRLAQVLLEVGLAEEALREAERALVRAPDDPSVHFVLGWVLGCDVLGQPNSVPVDRERAIAAYRRALELGSKEPMTRQNLAVLLETNKEGLRYGEGADLAGAAEVYRAYRKELSRSDLDGNLLIVLVRLGRYDELYEVAKAAPPATPQRNTMLVIAKLMTAGLHAARAALTAEGVPAPEQEAAWTAARETLYAQRAYAQVEKISASLTQGSDSLASRAARSKLDGIRRYEEVLSTRPPHVAAALRWIVALTRGTWTTDELGAVFAAATIAELEDATDDFLPGLRASSRGGQTRYAAAGLPLETGIDVMVHMVEVSSEGDDARGYRIRFHAGGEPTATLFVTKGPEGHRIRATSLMRSSIAAEANARLERGDAAGATQWLEWAVTDAEGELWKAVREVWGEGDERTADTLRLAAAMGMAGGVTAAKKAAPLLARALSKNVAAKHRSQLLYAASIAHRLASKFDASVRYAEALRALHPDAERAELLLLGAYRAAGRAEEVRGILAARLDKDPDGHFDRLSLALLDADEGRFTEARVGLNTLIERGWTNPTVQNHLAWFALFTEDRGSMLDDALAAASANNFSTPSSVHTLATVYAELEQVGPALQALRRLYALQGQQMAPPDWFVLGRLAETYGFAEAARRAYERALAPDPSLRNETKSSTSNLARGRLERMRAGL